ARSLDLGDRQAVRRFFGLPVGVSLTANLGRQLSEHEWQQLVVDLRETFDARGRVREEGAFRQWTNGNLQVMVEPTPDGNQVRMRTFKQDGPLYIGMGLGLIVLSIIGLGTKLAVGGEVMNLLGRFLPVMFIGTGMAVFGAVRLPGWARLR